MSDQNNVVQLKKLATKMTGKADVTGDTIADVIDFIQANYSGGGSGGTSITIVSAELNVDGQSKVDNGLITMSDGSTVDIVLTKIDSLTVTSEKGSAASQTIITVDPPLTSGNKYRYKIGTATIPAKHADMSSWTAWDGTSEITADDGVNLTIVECDSNDRAVRCGSCVVVAPIF